MTDIVFSRPNYCKIDLMPEALRGDSLFMQENELDMLKDSLRKRGVTGGLKGLMELAEEMGLLAEECAFWGDEFVGLEEGIFGSDSFMVTELTGKGDFFDVSEVPGERPKEVVRLGGKRGEVYQVSVGSAKVKE